MRRGATAIFVLLLVAAVRADDVPDALKPLVDTVDRCHRYNDLVRQSGWKTIYRLSFERKPQESDVRLLSPANVPGLVRVVPEGLQFDVSRLERGLLQFGPKVKGEFALQVRAKTISQRLNDLSLVTDGVGQGPGLQFGGYANTRNILWTGAGGPEDGIEGDHWPRIERNKWHIIRLEVKRDQIIGLVDGRLVARGRPGEQHDFTRELQPLLYVYASTAVIDEYRVEVPQEAVDEQGTWEQAFVNRTRAQVAADLGQIASLLGDPDYPTRQAAHELLARAGPLAIDVLRQAARAEPLEARLRARQLLARLGQPLEDDAEPASPPADPPDAAP